MSAACRPRRQHGISLLESLTAMVVMAVGVLGMLGVQLRSLADTQSGVRHAQAIQLIEDLGERILSHPNALGDPGAYLMDWNTAPAAPKDCRMGGNTASSWCTAQELAAFDGHRWLQAVRAQLPQGDATVFLPGPGAGQLGVMLAWRENERPGLALPMASTMGTVRCPEQRRCHLHYIRLTQRCLPDTAEANALHCPR
ncbi:MAG: type IV pilus modification protein PilV [Burkholderiaceae bacterium]|nr:type IV pilus modification protein PilV [Burkholderiaceae bacterium]